RAARDPDAVGRDPVPRTGRGRARAPPHPGRLPLHRRGRGRVDGGERRPGGDATGRPAAHRVVGLARPPPRRRSPDGLARRPRHPARRPARRRVLRVRAGDRRPLDAASLPLRGALGPSGAAPRGRARHPELAAHGVPLGAHRPGAERAARARRRRTRRSRRAGPRGDPLRQPDDGARRADHPAHRDAPTARRVRERHAPRDRVGGLAGLRRYRRRRARRRADRARRRRPRRAPVVVPAPPAGAHPARPLHLQRRARLRGARPPPLRDRPGGGVVRLATIRLGDRTAAVRVEGDTAVELGVPDVRAVLERGEWRSWAAAIDGPRHPSAAVDHAPLVPNPSKILCVGLNYRSHILEMGRELPTHPTLFAKFADTLMGARDDLVLPAVSDEVDWEAELGVVIGAPVRRASSAEAAAAIAGYTVLNDVSMRDWQWRTAQWLSGKAFEASTPVGPWLVTPDEVGDAADLALRCEVDGMVMQSSRTSDLLFRPADLVAYISQI